MNAVGVFMNNLGVIHKKTFAAQLPDAAERSRLVGNVLVELATALTPRRPQCN